MKQQEELRQKLATPNTAAKGKKGNAMKCKRSLNDGIFPQISIFEQVAKNLDKDMKGGLPNLETIQDLLYIPDKRVKRKKSKGSTRAHKSSRKSRKNKRHLETSSSSSDESVTSSSESDTPSSDTEGSSDGDVR